MNHFKIDGFKFDNIDRILLRNECLPRYSQPLSFSETFIEDCSRESILFTKLINMIVERNNSNFISYCSSNCMVPGLYIPLVEGGFGFSFSSQKSSKRVHSFSREYLTGNILIADRSTQLYFNTIEIDNEMTTS
jgi:1,4-alpha-glucan branching enzyme